MSISAVFDIGKTRSKLAIVAHHGNGLDVLTSAVHDSVSVNSGLYPSLDVEATWSWMLSALRNSGHAPQVTRCIVATHGAAFALLDDVELVFPIMDYEFDGFGEIGRRYDTKRGKFGDTYSPPLPFGLNAARQVYWLQETQPKTFARVQSIVPYPQYWSARLCGVVATEVTSLGSHTDLWRPKEKSYSSLVHEQGWLDRMPPLYPAWQPLATVRPEVANAAGLDADCEVLCGIHDSNASYLCHLSTDKRSDAIVSTGTWVICMAPGAPLDTLEPDRDTLCNVDVLSRPLPCARFMGGREYAEITSGTSALSAASLADADRIMSRETFALPTFCEEVGPFPNQPGKVIGTVRTPAESRALASLYCALMTDYCLDLLGVTSDVIIEGRFVDDPIYIEALAHFRRDAIVRVSTDYTGTILGAARLVNWPNAVAVSPPEYRATRPPVTYLDYRRRWREALRS